MEQLRKHKDECHTFNKGLDDHSFPVQIERSKEAGNSFGLKLGLYTESSQNDIKIYIHNQSRNFNLKKEITVSHGLQKNVIMSRVFNYKLAAPYSNCKKQIVINRKG